MKFILKIVRLKKNILQLLFIAIIPSVFSFTIQAQKDTAHLSLEMILVKMDTSYPALLQYHEKLKSIEALAKGANSWMPPTLSVGVDRFGYAPGMWGEQSPMNQAGIMISAEQMIPNPKKLDARSNYILSQTLPLKYDSAWLKNNLRASVRLYYYERFIAEKKLAILKESESLLDMLIETAEKRYAVNQSELPTIFKAKARRAELTNMEAMFKSQIAESTIGLNTLMNRDVNTPFIIDTMVVLKNYSDSVSYKELLNRSDLLAVDASINSMRQEQNLMKSNLKPDFGVRATHMQMLGMPNQFSVMGMIVIPIAPWSSGMYRSEVLALDFQIQSMQLEKENMQLMSKQMAAEKLVMLKYETQQLNNYDSLIIPAYQNNFDASLLAYKENTGNFFIVLDAWDMLLMKKIEAADQLHKILIPQTQYEYEMEK